MNRVELSPDHLNSGMRVERNRIEYGRQSHQITKRADTQSGKVVFAFFSGFLLRKNILFSEKAKRSVTEIWLSKF